MNAIVRHCGFCLALALWGPIAGATAQTVPPATDGDLLLPPDLRPGARRAAEPAPPLGHSRASGRSKAAGRSMPDVDTPRHRERQQVEHPVDLGVVMRGGSATRRIVSPLGNSQAVRESGSTFGAGMRFGF